MTDEADKMKAVGSFKAAESYTFSLEFDRVRGHYTGTGRACWHPNEMLALVSRRRSTPAKFRFDRVAALRRFIFGSVPGLES